MSSLSDSMLSRIIHETLPSFQATSVRDLNLGYGFLFYGLSRLLRPRTVVTVGSKAGFSVICFALGLKDNAGALIKSVQCYDTTLQLQNALTKVYFVDPSYSMARGDTGAWYGIGFWDDNAKVRAHWEKFGVGDRIEHFKMTSEEFCDRGYCPRDIDLLYIDGDHSYQGIAGDFNRFSSFLRRDALVLAHDVDPRLRAEFHEAGGFEAINNLDPAKYEVFRFPIYPGMALVRKKT